MSDDVMRVELVSADRLVWSGDASRVIARTTEGDVGILPHHAPMLSLLVQSVVDVTTSENETWIAAVDSGFLSVANNVVLILADRAEMSHDIDLERARTDLDRSHHQGTDEDEATERAARAWAEARVRAAEKSS
jgi:F-type H+-transporting ATPase subunit epsilon